MSQADETGDFEIGRQKLHRAGTSVRGNYHSGVTAGLASGRTELAGRFGVLRTEDFNDVAPPMYASAGLGSRF